MNSEFPITPKELENLRLHIGALSTLLYAASNPEQMSNMTAGVWGRGMARNMFLAMRIFGNITNRKNQGLGKEDTSERCNAVVAELHADPNHQFTIRVGPKDFATLIGVIQLAVRHPKLSQTPACGHVVRMTQAFIDSVPDTLPKYKALLNEGWNNAQSPIQPPSTPPRT